MRFSTWCWKLSTEKNIWSGSKYFRVTDDADSPSELTPLRTAVYKYEFLFCAEQLSNQKMKSFVSQFFLIKLTNMLATSAAGCPLPPLCQSTPVALWFLFFLSTNRSKYFIMYSNTFAKGYYLQSKKSSQPDNFLHIKRYNFFVVSTFAILFLMISFSCTINKCWFFIFSIFIWLT